MKLKYRKEKKILILKSKRGGWEEKKHNKKIKKYLIFSQSAPYLATLKWNLNYHLLNLLMILVWLQIQFTNHRNPCHWLLNLENWKKVIGSTKLQRWNSLAIFSQNSNSKLILKIHQLNSLKLSLSQFKIHPKLIKSSILFLKFLYLL